MTQDHPARGFARWIDAHSHLHDPRLSGRQESIVAEMRAAGIDGCVANGTGPDDWGAVADLARSFPGSVRPSFGLHPWKVKDAPRDWKDRLLDWLGAFPEAGVGEIGLDLWIPDPRIDLQVEAFRWQWEQAAAADRSVSVHCLKAWGPLLDQLAAWPPRPGRVLVHAFGGSAEVAARLVGLGCYLGFNGYFLQPRKAPVAAVFASLRADRILVESDSPDMGPPPELRTHFLPDPALNHPANLAWAASELARRRGESVEAFAAQTMENTRHWLGD